MSKRCKLQKEYYKEFGNYKGDGKYSDHYVKWLENEVLALRILAAYRSNDNNYTIEEAEKELLDLFIVRLSLPSDEVKNYCNAIEKQEAKLISPAKMTWYKAGIEQGLRAYKLLLKDYLKGNEA